MVLGNHDTRPVKLIKNERKMRVDFEMIEFPECSEMCLFGEQVTEVVLTPPHS